MKIEYHIGDFMDYCKDRDCNFTEMIDRMGADTAETENQNFHCNGLENSI